LSSILYVCATCRYTRADECEPNGKTGGELLADELRLQLDDHARDGIELRRFDCLMACSRHCVVHLRAPGKIGYVIGDLPPTTEGARALLFYTRKYQQSSDGLVPYVDWPDAIKEHVIARVPPLNPDD